MHADERHDAGPTDPLAEAIDNWGRAIKALDAERATDADSPAAVNAEHAERVARLVVVALLRERATGVERA